MTMPTYRVYKLKSGETIITEFLRVEEINSRKGTKAHMIKQPLLLGDIEMAPWVCGVIIDPDDEFPLMESLIALWFEEDKIDPIWLENYEYAIE